jgi:hypothetical protein
MQMMGRPKADHPWRRAMHPNSIANLQPHPENLRLQIGEVPVEKLQQAFKKSRLTKCELARRLGWYKKVPNLHRLNVALGLERGSTGNYQKGVRYATALRICEALGVSPFDCGC